jgi:hypothetical protein
VSVREAQTESLIRLLNAVPGADTRVLHECDPPGWRQVELGIPRGLDGAADLLASIARAGIGISHFERMNVSLADLLERIVLQQKNAADA